MQQRKVGIVKPAECGSALLRAIVPPKTVTVFLRLVRGFVSSKREGQHLRDLEFRNGSLDVTLPRDESSLRYSVLERYVTELIAVNRDVLVVNGMIFIP